MLRVLKHNFGSEVCSYEYQYISSLRNMFKKRNGTRNMLDMVSLAMAEKMECKDRSAYTATEKIY